jgi:hypothetical protein
VVVDVSNTGVFSGKGYYTPARAYVVYGNELRGDIDLGGLATVDSKSTVPPPVP